MLHLLYNIIHIVYIFSIIFLIHKTDCITLGFIDSTSKLGAAEQVAYKMQIPNNVNSDRDDIQEIQDERQQVPVDQHQEQFNDDWILEVTIKTSKILLIGGLLICTILAI